MKKFKLAFAMSIVLLVTACQNQKESLDAVGIMPLPASVVPASGSFQVNESTSIQISGAGEELSFIADYLAQKLRNATGFAIPVSGDAGSIVLDLKSNSGDESYELEIGEEKIVISSNGASGIFYGVQTLLQAFPAELLAPNPSNQTWEVPAGKIVDKPEYAYR
ncbi:MAG TPA: beta-N-acetylhexosaminidase, partial [Algoriphagus sp.]|nr:beta-N-acetylhexosaminidase [Algoriphagus sp.]